MPVEHAVFNEETGLWYQADKKWYEGVKAATYPEAFELLYGHSEPIPPQQRAPRRHHEGD